MKSTLYSRLPVLVIAVMLAACTDASPKKDKKAQLEKLKNEQVSLATEIKKIEEEIAKDDTTTVTVKSKAVIVTSLTPRKFDHYVQTQGRVEAEDNIAVSAKSMGVVTAVYVKEGQSVSKGQVLAQIDNALVTRGIEGMKSQVELAQSIYDRQKNLWDQKIGTEVQFLQAKTSKDGLDKQLASLQEQNEMTRIKSPINGAVDEVFAKIGENLAPGMPAVRVVNTSDLKLTANVSEAYVTDIKKGNKVLVNIPELKKEIEARVTFVGRTIDPLSRTFVVEINLPANVDLRPNMTGVIKVVYHTEAAAILVPIDIVQDVNGEKVVFVSETKDGQSIARKKVVTLNGVFDGLAQVNGLSSGENVITIGYQGLSDGEFIKQ